MKIERLREILNMGESPYSDLKPEEEEDERMFMDGLKCSICGRTCGTDWTLYNSSIMHPKCIPRTESIGYYWGPRITSTQSAPPIGPCDTTYPDSEERRWRMTDKDDPWHVRCPNCGHIGLLDHEQTIPAEGVYDHWMKCEYCNADVAIPIKGWAKRWVN